MLLVAVKFFKEKIVNGEEASLKVDKKEQVVLAAKRGDILATDGRKLACSINEYTVYMDPCADGLKKIFDKEIDSLAIYLSRFFKDRTPAQYKKYICDSRAKGRRYIRLTPTGRRLTLTEKKIVTSFPILRLGRNRGGCLVEESGARERPFGLLAARTVGRLYDDKDKGGMYGLEQSFDKQLRGINGVGQKICIGGRWLNRTDVAPEDGLDVHTTIDIDIQDVAEHSLMTQLQRREAEYGIALVMEVKTGAIKAIVNLKRREDGSYDENYYNFAIGTAVDPGSTFKLATMMACLEDGYSRPTDTINIFGGQYKFYDRVLKDSHQGEETYITLSRAFEESSNVAFARLAVKNYGTNPQRYIDRLNDFGLCDSLGLDIVGEKKTFLKSVGAKNWYGTTLPWMSIGYELQITPIQLLAFYNAVANGGKMMRPMLVQSLDKDGEVYKSYHPEVLRSSIASRKTIKTVHEMLKGVVEKGTAMNINNTPYKIAGKTGTAQTVKNGVYQKTYLASFAGFFPADAPLYSCLVMVYGAKTGLYGNVVAGAVVKDIADRLYAAEFKKGNVLQTNEIKLTNNMPYSKGGKARELKKVLNELDIPHSSLKSNSEWLSATAQDNDIKLKERYFVNSQVPDVRGMGAADAVCVLERAGLKVQLSGYGHVSMQSLSPNSIAPKGSQIKLTLKN
ncbi:MAG: penicillin-binding protein [Bacteroidia bacterium]|nr:penicillin-binding protein [Bacteroidia bacterium]